MGGAASGKFTVKSCGKAHAWCAECRPAQASAQRRPKPPPKVHDKPCRNCGRCDACLGITAPEGMKICRSCGKTKPLTAFAKRADTGGYRNHCIACRNSGLKPLRCTKCGFRFYSSNTGRALCKVCRPLLTKPCARCGTEFTGGSEAKRYCAVACQEAALKEQREEARRLQRLEALIAYSGAVPACACCGETELLFLSLDHLNGGGGRQRKETGGGGFYVWLRKQGYPEGFQVLCHNCNLGRQINGGICPHKQE